MKTFWTIKRKLLFFLLSVSLVPITVITIIYYLSARRELIQQINQKMTVVAESKKLHAETFLNAIKGRCVDFSSDGYIRNTLAKINRKEVYKQDNIIALCKHLKDNKMTLDPDIAAITILDKSGMVAASTVNSIIGKDFSDHEEFTRVIVNDSNEAFSYHSNLSEHLYPGSLEVAAPVTSMDSSEIIGVLINAYKQEIVNDITSNRNGMGESGEIVIGVREGNTILFLNSLRNRPEDVETLKIPFEEETAEPMRLALEAHSGTIIGPDYRGKVVIAAYQYLPSVGWGMVAKMDKAEAFRPLRVLSTIAFTLAGISTFIVVCAGIVFTNRITKPIRELTHATERFANGKLGYDISIRRNDEIGILAMSFNNMAKKLSGEITEHKHSRKELVASNKELEAFCYSVSHDLRAPLRSIEGFSETLVERYAESLDTQAKDYFNRIQRATRHMSQLIDDLLRLSRITREDMDYETVDMSGMVQEIITELKNKQPGRQVEFVVSKKIKVNGDKRLLKVALENLLENAWKFTEKHKYSRIEFGIKRDDGKKLYFLSDDGAGFEMAYADKLFTAFQRLHGSDEFKGTGIGLTTVQRVIHRHGGHIWAEGAVGRGATFYFTL